MQSHLAVSDIREFSDNKHKQVDDYPYGGGAGMVLKPEPMFQAVETLTEGLIRSHVLF